MKIICVRDSDSEGRLTKGKMYDAEIDNYDRGMIIVPRDDTMRFGVWYENRFEHLPEVDVKTCFHCKMTDPASDEGGDDNCNHLWIDP